MANPGPQAEGSAVAPLAHGWTYLIHGTDTSRSWDLDAGQVRISGLGLSAITLEDQSRDRALTSGLLAKGVATAGYDTTAGYARQGGTGSTPVEIRIVFLRADLAANTKPKDDVTDLAASLRPEVRRLVAKYHQPRHAVVPRGETLLRLGDGGNENGRRVVYYVPERVAPLYLQALTSSRVQASPALRAAATRALQSAQQMSL
jgi:hypothetical protein